MWRNKGYWITGCVLIVGSGVVVWVHPALSWLNLPGLVLVLGGTFLASVIGHSFERVVSLLRRVPILLRDNSVPELRDREALLQIAGLHRRGDLRAAERVGQNLQDDFLRQGVHVALDPQNGNELARLLQWRIRRWQEQDAAESRILRTMANFAPAFGMLGTVLGLVGLMDQLGRGGLDQLGVAMGFALLATLYGLLAANLLLRPLALKMENRSRQQLSHMAFLLEALVMVHERQHPLLIGEYLDCAGDASVKHLAAANSPSAPDVPQHPSQRLRLEQV